MRNNDKETDTLRLNDLALQYGLTFTCVRSTYLFNDYTAHGLKQALGFVEGYDRANTEDEPGLPLGILQ
ncbi:MAG TPA: hypothetical protein VJX94_03190 [Stellaceae bacterium]|nr:hypothetical protein [Stellaceae bacterium]